MKNILYLHEHFTKLIVIFFFEFGLETKYKHLKLNEMK